VITGLDVVAVGDSANCIGDTGVIVNCGDCVGESGTKTECTVSGTVVGDIGNSRGDIGGKYAGDLGVIILCGITRSRRGGVAGITKSSSYNKKENKMLE
jgi:hypothetical protein